MTKKVKIALGVLSSVVSIGTIAAAIYFLKNKSSKMEEDIEREDLNDDSDYCVEYDMELDYGFYEFQSIKEMKSAIDSNMFNVDAYYEVDNKGYLVVLLDGNEDMLYKYEARKLNSVEVDELLQKTVVDSMYFRFDEQENMYSFIKVVDKIVPGMSRIPLIVYKSSYYINLSKFDTKFHEQIRIAATEFMGEEIKDMYIANKLKESFDLEG